MNYRAVVSFRSSVWNEMLVTKAVAAHATSSNVRVSQAGSMFPCPLKINPNVPLFPQNNFPIYFLLFPKIYVLKLMFPCSLKVNGNVPLFPKSKWPRSFVPQNPGRPSNVTQLTCCTVDWVYLAIVFIFAINRDWSGSINNWEHFPVSFRKSSL